MFITCSYSQSFTGKLEFTQLSIGHPQSYVSLDSILRLSHPAIPNEDKDDAYICDAVLCNYFFSIFMCSLNYLVLKHSYVSKNQLCL